MKESLGNWYDKVSDNEKSQESIRPIEGKQEKKEDILQKRLEMDLKKGW